MAESNEKVALGRFSSQKMPSVSRKIHSEEEELDLDDLCDPYSQAVQVEIYEREYQLGRDTAHRRMLADGFKLGFNKTYKFGQLLACFNWLDKELEWDGQSNFQNCQDISNLGSNRLSGLEFLILSKPSDSLQKRLLKKLYKLRSIASEFPKFQKSFIEYDNDEQTSSNLRKTNGKDDIEALDRIWEYYNSLYTIGNSSQNGNNQNEEYDPQVANNENKQNDDHDIHKKILEFHSIFKQLLLLLKIHKNRKHN